MDNPYAEEQAKILARIIDSAEKINESMLELNTSIQQINVYNSSVAEVVELWQTYAQSVSHNLASGTDLKLEDPI